MKFQLRQDLPELSTTNHGSIPYNLSSPEIHQLESSGPFHATSKVWLERSMILERKAPHPAGLTSSPIFNKSNLHGDK